MSFFANPSAGTISAICSKLLHRQSAMIHIKIFMHFFFALLIYNYTRSISILILLLNMISSKHTSKDRKSKVKSEHAKVTAFPEFPANIPKHNSWWWYDGWWSMHGCHGNCINFDFRIEHESIFLFIYS